MSTLSEIRAMEEHIAELVQQIKKDIEEETAKVTIDGVRIIAPNMATVNTSFLGNNIWSPEYYIPSAQARLIASALSKIDTVTALVKRLNEIIATGYVKYSGSKHPVNKATIAVLERYI